MTLPQVNKALKLAGIDAELVKGDGYFYFIGPDVELAYTTDVMVNRLSVLTVQQWVAEALAFKTESKSHHVRGNTFARRILADND